jgi:hypothetical protein
VVERTDDIMFSQHVLLQKMKMALEKPSPGQELEQELAQMTEQDVNPYIKLLHEWEQKKKVSMFIYAALACGRVLPQDVVFQSLCVCVSECESV